MALKRQIETNVAETDAAFGQIEDLLNHVQL
jgi:hypothetical protein